MSQIWQATPRDTLVLRDGKPMVEGAGVATSLPLPWPSTVAGLARTNAGRNPQTGQFVLSPEEAKRIAVQGPWLALLDKVGNTSVNDWLFPAPLDVLWHRADKTKSDGAEPLAERYRLQPCAVQDGEQTDLPLLPLQIAADVELPKGKPAAGPALWQWTDLQKWLTEPKPKDAPAKDFGWQLPLHEPRTHVSIDGKTQTAQDGALFSIDHIRPWVRKSGDDKTQQPVAVCFGCEDKRLQAGTVFLGGERRVTYLEQSKAAQPSLPKMDFAKGMLRVVLLTPGLFSAGYAPDVRRWGAELVAAAVGRPQPLSGWDFEKKGPKASRYMAPAGSVYWLKFDNSEAAAAWADKHWWKCISDEPQDRLDGFGLCVVGVG